MNKENYDRGHFNSLAPSSSLKLVQACAANWVGEQVPQYPQIFFFLKLKNQSFIDKFWVQISLNFLVVCSLTFLQNLSFL